MRCLDCERESVNLVGTRVGGEQIEGRGGQGKGWREARTREWRRGVRSREGDINVLMSYESGNGRNATRPLPLHKPPHAHDTHMNQSTESGNGHNEILPRQRPQRNPPIQANINQSHDMIPTHHMIHMSYDLARQRPHKILQRQRLQQNCNGNGRNEIQSCNGNGHNERNENQSCHNHTHDS